MRNLLAFLAAAALVFLGVGWYLDWYKVKSVPSAPGRQSFNIDVDKEKLTRDVQQGVRKTEEKVHEVLEKRRQEANPTGAPARPAEAVPGGGPVAPRVVISAEEEATRPGVVSGP